MILSSINLPLLGWSIIAPRRYFNDCGNPVTGWQNIDGGWFFFNSDSTLIIDDWAACGSTYFRMDPNGKASATSITIVSRDVVTPLGTVKGQLITGTDKAAPTVIFSHGLGGNGGYFLEEAVEIARTGINVFIFDYIGGSPTSTSGGSYQKMSVETERVQLDAIVSQVRTWAEVDSARLYLAGHSQGGLLSTKVAASRDDIAGLILIAPALNLGDMVRAQCKSLDKVGNTVTFLEQKLGRIYAEDIWNITEADTEAAYKGTSIVFHGWKDDIIEPQVAIRAAQTWGDACELHMLSDDHISIVDPDPIIAKQIHRYIMNGV